MNTQEKRQIPSSRHSVNPSLRQSVTPSIRHSVNPSLRQSACINSAGPGAHFLDVWCGRLSLMPVEKQEIWLKSNQKLLDTLPED